MSSRKYPLLTEIARCALVGTNVVRSLTREQTDAQIELRGFLGTADIIIPFRENRAAMSATGQTSVAGDQGGMTIGTQVPEIGTALRANLVLAQLGARVFEGLSGNVNLPHGGPAIAAAWFAENGSITDAGSTFAQFALTPLRVAAYLTVSTQLINQQQNVEAWLRNELMAALAVEIQRVAIAGTGASNQPLGIINTSGVGSVAGGTNGLAPTHAHMAALEYAVTGTKQADRGHCAYLCSPYVRQKLRQTFINGAGSEPVWSREQAYSLLGHPAGVTPSSPDTLTKGTSSGVCSAIVFGEMSELMIGLWGDGIAVEALGV